MMKDSETALKDKTKNRIIPVKKLETLPLCHREVISPDYIDSLGHMNVRWYLALYEASAWNFFSTYGMDENYFRKTRSGLFALKHFIQYLSEVTKGQTVALRTRLLGISEKQLYFMIFMINETTGKLASTVEALGAHINLKTRQSSPLPTEIWKRLDSKLKEDQKLDWKPPVSSAIKL